MFANVTADNVEREGPAVAQMLGLLWTLLRHASVGRVYGTAKTTVCTYGVLCVMQGNT